MVVLSSRTRPPPQFVDCAGSDAVGRSASRGQLAVAEITEFTFLKDCLSRSRAGEYRGAGRLVKHFLQTCSKLAPNIDGPDLGYDAE